MQNILRNFTGFTALLWVHCLTFPAMAGDLTPPAGPVAPTMKTLLEVEPRTAIESFPFVISASGSYYLTENLNGVPGSNGIVINADNVSIDLCGFTISGVTGAIDGIRVVADRRNIRVQNGTIRGFDGDGIDALSADNSVVSEVSISQCGGVGIKIGAGSRISGCQVSNCGGAGIVTDVPAVGTLIQHCSSVENGGSGIAVEDGCSIIDCVAVENSIAGISTGDGTTIFRCTARGNQNNGISTGSGCSITASSAFMNGAVGIRTQKNCIVSDCTSAENLAEGILIDDSSYVVNCVSSQNSQGGIRTFQSATIHGCAVQRNFGMGIFLGSGSQLLDSTVVENEGVSIEATSDCTIRRNQIQKASNTGILVTGTSCFVAENTVEGGTTAFNIAPDNRFGPIADVSAATDISAVAAANHPWANFDY